MPTQHITPQISILWEMGFTVEKARAALKEGGNVPEAVEYLISKRHIVDDGEGGGDVGHQEQIWAGGVNRIVQDDGGCAAGGSARGQGGAAETKTDQKANDDAPVILDIVEHVYIYA